MIRDEHIRQWHHLAPWTHWGHVEQDLVICRAIVEIFSDSFLAQELAWRGGTALHKLYLQPQARYSEDIDLVQIHPGPIKPIVERLDKALAWLPGKRFDIRRFGFRLRFRYESEIPPIEQMSLKVETNTYEHFAELGFIHQPFSVDSAWFSGSCNVTTFTITELLATKFRALYQRKKLRDLFDMDYALQKTDFDRDEMLRCWRKYMSLKDAAVPNWREFVANMELKMSDPEYLNDMQGILRPDVPFDAHSAYGRIRHALIDKLMTAKDLESVNKQNKKQ